ncbi:DUF2382 domain-containing protein [Nonomuraea terrae]|uniref:DUF2382 domain-containing protein n=1 Tax=Nonomuraea terrae TaxID=2530383 RepID=A0A4R4XM91_9ACTN|nr:PRC and DUF2382 domain-containing protein [Nonomuraea terrae]TDD31692.1 DUF2382 domain-containing protein [Nonomuraea terrae]
MAENCPASVCRYSDLGYSSLLNQDEHIRGIVVAMQTEIRNLLDCHVVGSDGQSIGKVGQVYLNDRTGEPEWVTVRTGFFGMKQTFVPLASARRSGGEIRVPYDKEMIKGAPNIDVDDRLNLDEEADLYRYYGMQPSTIPRQRVGEQGAAGTTAETAGTAGPTAGTTAGTTAGRFTEKPGERPYEPTGKGVAGETREGFAEERDIEMIRCEEQLHIGKESREKGRVRLHKYVETETVQETVPLSHEEIVIEREPIREGEVTGTYEIGEEDRQLILHEERPIVGKETRPVERVHVRKQEIRHEETVEGQVRKERLQIDEEGDTRADTRGDKKLFGRGKEPPPRR